MSIQWTGLTDLIMNLGKVPDNMKRELASMTQELFDDTLLRYIENLSGATPSTAADPLPVGIDSGDLIGHAWSDSQVTGENSFQLKNDSDHAGPVEFGTEHMEPRRPMGDAVDILESQMNAKLDEVMGNVIP